MPSRVARHAPTDCSHLLPSMDGRGLCWNHAFFFFFFLVITASRSNAEKTGVDWDFCLRIPSSFTKKKRVMLGCRIITDQLKLFLFNSFFFYPSASKLMLPKWVLAFTVACVSAMDLHFTSRFCLYDLRVGYPLLGSLNGTPKFLPVLHRTWTVPK